MLEGQVESDNSITLTKKINNDKGGINTIKFSGKILHEDKNIKGKAI